ncbi:hypothetical protein DYU11_25730 [Fibrisoma montanum]|uniref:Uncharacterized protein n=1 Tax=Fibrisoma montanum TaxID=2305895 RepID=A0A418M1T5_9BACT|nr:hypothetical protein [Fibrisoma montanum]RIV19496.1 hypothetical protein DYU11_25730 [Fibrisoma montanum]
MTDHQLAGLALELSRHNSRLVTSLGASPTWLTADVDGTRLTEWTLLDVLTGYGLPSQQIVFQYADQAYGLALPGRYWATFHQ